MIIHTAGVRATIAIRFIDLPSIIGCLSPLAAWIAVKIQAVDVEYLLHFNGRGLLRRGGELGGVSRMSSHRAGMDSVSVCQRCSGPTSRTV